MAGTAIPATGAAWDATIPDNSQPHGNDYNEHRETKLAVGIRMTKEHVAFAGSSVGGEHKPGSARIYVGDYSASSAGDALPTTKPDGATALDSDDAGMLAWDTDATYGRLLYKWSGAAWEEFMVSLESAQTIAGVKTFASPVINTGISGTAVLDEDDLASNSATKIATQQSLKAYIDAQTVFGTRISRSQNTYYEAETNGIVHGYSGTNVTIKGYTDELEEPTTLVQWGYSASGIAPISFPVKKGDYWMVSGAISLYWLPIGG